MLHRLPFFLSFSFFLLFKSQVDTFEVREAFICLFFIDLLLLKLEYLHILVDLCSLIVDLADHKLISFCQLLFERLNQLHAHIDSAVYLGFLVEDFHGALDVVLSIK